MQNDLMGLIYTGESNAEMRELTASRDVAAIPFCGRYRLIDFSLSSMVNSGIRNVGVILQRNYNSLMEHLGSGREWDLHGKRSGLVLLPPFGSRQDVGVYGGLMDALRSNLGYLRHSKEKYVVVTDTHMLYSADYENLLRDHEQSGADITLLYTRDPKVRRNCKGRYLQVENDGTVTGLEVDPLVTRLPYTYMEAFCTRRERLIQLVDQAVSRHQYHFVRDLLMDIIREGSFKVRGYEHQGSVWFMDSVQSYYNCSMEMLKPEIRANLFKLDRPVLTRLRDEMPSRYLHGAQVKNSLIADGCVIEGTVENSILFRGVQVEPGAVVRNCIIMQDADIRRDSELDHCILDMETTVLDRTRLSGARSYPVVIAKNMVV